MIDFEFIADHKFRHLLIRDFNELEICIKHEANKSAVILSGSIIEAVLVEYLLLNNSDEQRKDRLLKMRFGELIEEAVKADLISLTEKALSTVIKDYRNLVHAGREIREDEGIDSETANISYNLVKMVIKSIENKYVEKYGFKADEIYNKIVQDSSTICIFDKLLQKMNSFERVRLLKKLVEYKITNFNNPQFYFDKKYIHYLKSVIDDEDLLKFCKELLKEVEQGEKNRVIPLFIIFGDILYLLPDQEIEMIMIYIYDITDDISPFEVYQFPNWILDIYSFLKNYSKGTVLGDKYLDLLLKIVQYSHIAKGELWNYCNAYDVLLGDFDDGDRKQIEELVRKKVVNTAGDRFYQEYEQYNDVPF